MAGPRNLHFKHAGIFILEFENSGLGLSSQQIFAECWFFNSNDVYLRKPLDFLAHFQSRSIVLWVKLPQASLCVCALSRLNSSFAWHYLLPSHSSSSSQLARTLKGD